MTERFLIDADIAVFALRRTRGVVARMATVATGALCTSALVHSQLVQGVPGRPDPAAEARLIAAFVATVTVLDYGVAASQAYATVVAAIGFNRVQVLDRMIAAHAISLDATLVTNNVRDFAAIPGLRVQNWAEAA